jgi:hypothetical protein
MNLRLFLVILALSFGGCNYNPAEKIYGAWEGQEADGSRMIMVFEKSGRLSVVAGSERGEGTFVVHPNTAPIELDLDFQLGRDRINAKSIFVFLSDARLKLAQPTQERPKDFAKTLILERRQL